MKILCITCMFMVSQLLMPFTVFGQEKIVTEPTAEIIKVVETGIKGDDGSPQVKVTVRTTNLYKEAKSLYSFVTTNKDWDFGNAQTKGRTSGDFNFIGYIYPSNITKDNKFSIQILGDGKKKLGRIPSDKNKYIKFIPSEFGIK